MSTQTLTHTEASRSTALPRALVATYALAAYAIGTGSLFWVIFAAGGLAPHGLSAWQVSGPVAAIAINILLVVAFATQHTIMARNWFKTAVQKVIPQPIERSTYVLAAGIAMSALVYFWQSVPGELWAIESTLAAVVIRAVSYLLAGDSH